MAEGTGLGGTEIRTQMKRARHLLSLNLSETVSPDALCEIGISENSEVYNGSTVANVLEVERQLQLAETTA